MKSVLSPRCHLGKKVQQVDSVTRTVMGIEAMGVCGVGKGERVW